MAQAGLADTTRRHLFAVGSAAAAIAAAPAIAKATTPDAELLALGRRYDELHAEAHAASVEWDRLSDLAESRLPPMPEALKVQRDDWFPGAERRQTYYDAASVRHIAKHLPNAERLARSGINRSVAVRMSEVVAAWYERLAMRAALVDAAGVPAAAQAAGDLDAKVYEIEQKIAATPATTLQGFAVKASVVVRNLYTTDDLDFGETVALGLANEINAKRAV